ncbi:hypothetical protein JCGZ_04003 [Jatropha curcas]|uniref:Uncharacterized protein n=1 Tax=Jatropha curcas TaxID=180498 RepID=A0A067L2E0_JATCU|nr:hypothetical protein JCGZ_04003 [Jatropha curcas]
MAIKTTVALLIFLITLNFHFLGAKDWIKAAYYDSSSNLPASEVNSALFTHIFYAFAAINTSTYQLSFPFSTESSLSTFTVNIKRNNPSVIPVLSIGLAYRDYSTFSSMVSKPSYRKSFIKSSMKKARFHGFGGLDLCWLWPNTTSDMENIGVLLDEWREAINFESRNSNGTSEPKLILTMAIYRQPTIANTSFPVESMQRNLDWANLVAYDYHLPLKENITGNHAALFDPLGHISTDSGIKGWLRRGLTSEKLVLGLPYHGYAWKLVNSNDKYSIGALASGQEVTKDGSIGYKLIKSVIRDYGYGAISSYNATYVVNYFRIKSIWINFDDVEAIQTKILYAKTKGLLGYNAFQLGNDDDNWELSRAAYEVGEVHERKKHLWIRVSIPIAIITLLILLGFLSYYIKSRKLESKGKLSFGDTAVDEYQYQNAPNLQIFKFSEIKAATGNFSCENRLGEGGYGPVYKGKLAKGGEIAVKRLSKTSHQGFKEFMNEVKLTAKLQHVNLIRLLGFCTDRGEKMLIYEYMPNKSLDFYLFDQKRRLELNLERRVHIIEGIAQGLIGYVPPEYVKRGTYSMKYDVYSFGVLLLQIISGKRNTCFYGSSENLNLQEYAYELWKEKGGEEFIDPTLDDKCSSCKLLRYLQVALLCVQESPLDRPSILEVYSMLKNENDAIARPKRPAFSVLNCEDEENRHTPGQEICSVNDVSITEMLPR